MRMSIRGRQTASPDASCRYPCSSAAMVSSIVSSCCTSELLMMSVMAHFTFPAASGNDIARLSLHWRHFWKFGQHRIHMIPRLSAGCEDVEGGLILARVIQTPGGDHREVRHSAGLCEQTRPAVRAKSAAQCVAAVCSTIVILNRPGDL